MRKKMKRKNPWWLFPLFVITVIAVVILLMLGQQEASLFSAILVFAIWLIQKILSRDLKQYDKITEKQSNMIQQSANTRVDLELETTREMHNTLKNLWGQAVWLARDFKVLWPGQDKNEEQKQAYLAKLVEFDGYIAKESISLSNSIINPAKQIYASINEYRTGKDLRWTPPYDHESSLEGGRMMSAGAKNLRKAFDDLYQAIRAEFDLE